MPFGMAFPFGRDVKAHHRPTAFLAELQKEFLSNYSSADIADAPPYGMNAFGSRIAQLMRKYETTPPNDAIREAQAEISNVKVRIRS